MKTTQLGVLLRKRRIDSGERLFDLAKALGAKSSFLSAIELGKKGAPDRLLELIADHYKMTEQERLELFEAARASVPTIKVSLSGQSFMHRELAHAFARSFCDLDEEKVRKVLGIINSAGETQDDGPNV